MFALGTTDFGSHVHAATLSSILFRSRSRPFPSRYSVAEQPPHVDSRAWPAARAPPPGRRACKYQENLALLVVQRTLVSNPAPRTTRTTANAAEQKHRQGRGRGR
eukprot:6194648-Pleurochrysis_carterae.AAC.5